MVLDRFAATVLEIRDPRAYFASTSDSAPQPAITWADLIEEAAALWESLSQNHAFLDGNKRTAFAATYTFLAINGGRLTADAQQTYAFVDSLYEANQFAFDKLASWLRVHVKLREV